MIKKWLRKCPPYIQIGYLETCGRNKTFLRLKCIPCKQNLKQIVVPTKPGHGSYNLCEMGGICSSSSQAVAEKSGRNRSSFQVIEAASFGDSLKLSKLIKMGISVNSQDLAGRTALHLASSEGKVDAVKFLIQKKADINAKDRSGREPLHEACSWLGTEPLSTFLDLSVRSCQQSSRQIWKCKFGILQQEGSS